ncbi:MAG: hypothetical protein ACOY4K_11990 [Pseudomonadota bacterium]
MVRLLGILGVMLGLLLSGCASPPPARALAWSFQDQPGEGPKLAYGTPASDNVMLLMMCRPGADRLTVSLLGGSPREGIVLASGAEQARLGGAPVASPGWGQTIEAVAHPEIAPLARFARTGDLTLVDRGRRVRIDAAPAELPGVARFFAACGA